MSPHVVIEEGKKIVPSILFIDTNSGITNTLLDFLTGKLSSQGKLYVLSGKRINSDAEKISPLSIHLLDKLSEDLKYVVIFLDEESQKKKVLDIIEKLERYNSRIVLLLPYRIIERFIDILLKTKDQKNVTVGLLGDVFGNSNLTSPLSKIIQNSLLNKEVLISGNELLPIYPISDEDVASAVQYLLFGAKRPNAYYNLFYSEPETLISLSHVLKRHEPELSIKFEKVDMGLEKTRTQAEIDRYIRDRTTVPPMFLTSVLLGFEKSLVPLEKQAEGKKVKGKKKIQIFKKKKTKVSTIFKGVRYAVSAIILYILFVFLMFFASLFFFREGVINLNAGKDSASQNSFSISSRLYSVVRTPLFLLISYPSSLTHGKLEEALIAYDDMSQVVADIVPLVKTIRSNNPSLTKSQVEGLTASLMRFYFVLQRGNIPQFATLLKSANFKDISRLLPLTSVTSQALGYDRTQTYLLLFQNNTELRPTGGFIGSVGYLTVKDGKIENLTVNDVYDLDGQLKGHIEPPYIIRRYLQPHLYLRDSNFSPDFQASASMSALLYNAETGKNVDGVIALDTEVLKKILDIVGTVDLPGVGHVDSHNVVGLLENTIQQDFFPGSTQKKDTLKTLLNKITIDLDGNPALKLKLAKSFPQLLQEKHILISFATPSLEKAFIGTGFAGSLYDTRVAPNTLPDFLSINEANIGVNKANQFLTRSVTYSAFLRPTLLNSDVLVQYKNSGKDDYKAYIRFILPKDSQLLTINIDGTDQKIVPAVTDPGIYERKTFKAPSGLEVDQTQDNDHKTIGFIATVPRNSDSSIHVLYQNTRIVPLEDTFTYSLLYIKQPGTLPYPLTATLQTQGNYDINGKDGSSPVLYDQTIKTDKEVTAQVTRIKQ